MSTAAPDLEGLRSRKGAFRIALIPPDVLDALNAGLVETVNLNEFLALDLPRLARAVAAQIGLDPAAERLADTLAMLPSFKPMERHGHVARALYDLTVGHPERDAIAHALATHPSDVARCWAAQWIALAGLSLPQRLVSVRRFAADPHFGVREIAWMALRDAVIDAPDAAVAQLLPWTRDTDPNIRRFASELTRPRGVWCAPIDAFKTEPWRALALLEALRADAHRYVANSVANWLNDASKSRPEWVAALCKRWLAESPVEATRTIVRRASRTLRKSA